MRYSGGSKNGKAKKGDEDMANTPETLKKNKKNSENMNDIKTYLEKGIKRYDKALEKLSRN